MKINKRFLAMSLVVAGMSFFTSGIQTEAAFVKRTEVKKVQEQKKKMEMFTLQQQLSLAFSFGSPGKR